MKGNKGEWKKGQSGNPKGRPITEDTFKAIYDRISLQLEHQRALEGGKVEKITDKEKNVRTLIEIRDNTQLNPLVRMKAMELILKYTEKTPTTDIQLSGEVRTGENLNAEERKNLFNEIIGK